MRVWAVVVAGGSGRRMGGPRPKQFLALGGMPIVAHALRALSTFPPLCGAVVVAPADEVETMEREVLPHVSGFSVKVTAGGAERSDSVLNGLAALENASPDDLVLIHDGVRPFLPVEKLSALCEAASPDGAILAIGCRDTVKEVSGGLIASTLDRSRLYLAQTPQAFPFARILEAHRRAKMEGLAVTDDASIVEAFGGRVKIVEGDARNIKITTPEDMAVAEGLLGLSIAGGPRIGHGYDAHRLTEGRKLILGGVEIPHPTGLLGHSDADVLVHAIADAILGASKLGDIGRHFPDNKAEWKDADSLELLKTVAGKVAALGGKVVNVDATLMAQKPKIALHIPAMEENIAGALGISPSFVNVKGTTTEKMGFVGREEGMAAEAVALVSFGK